MSVLPASATRPEMVRVAGIALTLVVTVTPVPKVTTEAVKSPTKLLLKAAN